MENKVQDMFAEVDHAPSEPATNQIPAPVVPQNLNSQDLNTPTSLPPAKSGHLGMKIAVIVIIILAIAIVGLFLYKFVFVEREVNTVVNEPEVLNEEVVIEDEPVELLITEDNSLPDQDKDGLSDEEENVLGTNLLKIDTDTDGLSDFDEVKLYQTDPLDSDTDGDSFLDGDEIVNGYNPKGEGKLLNFEKALEQVK